MSWTLLVIVVVALGVAFLTAWARRAELAAMAAKVRERDEAVETGSADAKLQHPVVDLSRCLGCGTCVDVCPEDGVLELVHGQAMVVNGARCAGISACERECPVGAITVTLTNLEERDDVPVLSGELEAVGTPGLFLAGEVTAHALIKTAVDHGTEVAAAAAARCATLDSPPASSDPSAPLDLVIVGAGPAGIAAALEAKRRGMTFIVLEQEEDLGGTVAKYPRAKLVLTEPITLPLHGRVRSRSFRKEELIELWREIAAEQQLPIETGVVFDGVDTGADGTLAVRTAGDGTTYRAHNVCLAIGRRGVPNRLGVPGEDLPKVAYSLLDAHSFQKQRLLVVGGGDSAVEAALALAEQPGNRVWLSYRRERFVRIRTKNAKNLEAAVEAGRIRLLLNSDVLAIEPDRVRLRVRDPNGEGAKRIEMPNEHVFVMAGGVPPFELLKRAGVSFDPKLRPATEPLVEQGVGLLPALGIGFALALIALLWAVIHADYYTLPVAERPAHDKHADLRPGMGTGLWFGITSTVLIVINLLYLLRRSPRVPFQWGSLQLWMTSHLATGVLALLLAMLHGAMAPRDTHGGNAFWALVVLLVSGAIGRYLYAWVPRATNGRELELGEVKAQLAVVSAEWDRSADALRRRARAVIDELVDRAQWGSSFAARAFGFVGAQRRLREALRGLADHGREHGADEAQIAETLALTRRAHRAAVAAAHFEDLRAVLGSWRWIHRWVAVLLVVLLVVHIVYALTYGVMVFEGPVQ